MKKILVVDDDQALLKLTVIILEEMGYAASWTSSPDDAVVILSNPSNNFDVLLTDYNMPKINGIDLAAVAKNLRPEIMTVLMSSNQIIEEKALKSKVVDDFLFKSLELAKDLEILKEKIEKIVN